MSDRIKLPEPRSWLAFTAVSWSRKIIMVHLGRDSILTWDGAPIAVQTGGIVYIAQADRAPARTAAIEKYAGDLPQVRVSAQEFDFTVGTILTRAGLPLTRMEKPHDDPAR